MKIIKVLVLSILLMSAGGIAHAEPVNFVLAGTDEVRTPRGDDNVFRLVGVSMRFDGQVHDEIYLSINNVLSFGSYTDRRRTYYGAFISDLEVLNLPGVAFNSNDWTIDWAHNEDRIDQFMVADLTNGVLTISSSSIPYRRGAYVGLDLPAVTLSVLTINGVGTGQDVTFQYSVNGSPGSVDLELDYDDDSGSGIVLNDGTEISFSAYNARLSSSTLPLVAYSNAPVSASLVGNTLTCTPGSYAIGQSKVDVNSLVYSLYVNDALVSRVISDVDRAFDPSMLSATANGYTSTVTKSGITWNLGNTSNFKARCEVTAAAQNSMVTTSTNFVEDAAFTASAIAAAQVAEAATEAQRAAATAANFTAGAREMRKRIAARS